MIRGRSLLFAIPQVWAITMKSIGIGLLGFGTVGAGVVRGLQLNGDLISERLGVRPVLSGVADLDTKRDRGVVLEPGVLTADAGAVIASDRTQVVVELIGGTGVARELVKRALELGKPVVTANKALLAKHGKEILALAAKHNTDVFFGASVGGGIPVVRALREGLVANRVEMLVGILNGTCNYILTKMERDKLAFADVLAEAQRKGYAEADPGLDIDGHDTAHKAVILASLAYGFMIPLDQVYVEGIRGLSATEIEYASDLGYRIKLLAVIRRSDSGVEVRVHPSLVPREHVLASVGGVFNAVLIRGNLVGDSLYYGRGAGQDPTASTVLADVADAVRNLAMGCARRVPAVFQASSELPVRAMSEISTRYYLRMSLLDQPGVLGGITAVLGRHGISIASVLQKEASAGRHVPVVIVTHKARESEMNAALREIDSSGSVGAATIRLRIEEA